MLSDSLIEESPKLHNSQKKSQYKKINTKEIQIKSPNYQITYPNDNSVLNENFRKNTCEFTGKV